MSDDKCMREEKKLRYLKVQGTCDNEKPVGHSSRLCPARRTSNIEDRVPCVSPSIEE